MLGTKWATSTRCITADRLQHQIHHTVLQANLNLTLIIHQLPVQVRSFNTPDYLCFTKYLATVQHASYPYPPPIETHWPPTTTYLPSTTIAESPSSNAGYWRQSPSTANSVYGSESGVSGVHTPATSSTMSYGHPESHTWGQQPGFQPPPTRSMSYGNIEGLPQQYPGQGLGIQQDFGGELRLIHTPPPSTQVNLHHTLQRWEDQPLDPSPHQCFSLTNFTHQPGTPTNTTRCLQCKRLAAR